MRTLAHTPASAFLRLARPAGRSHGPPLLSAGGAAAHVPRPIFAAAPVAHASFVPHASRAESFLGRSLSRPLFLPSPARTPMCRSVAPAAEHGGEAGATGGEAAPADSYHIVNFYHLVSIEDPISEVAAHLAHVEAESLDLKGRIYINHQGINAQYSGPEEDAHAYVRWVEGRLAPGASIRWITDPVEGHQFPRLALKHRKNLVAVPGETTSHLDLSDDSKRAVKLNPSEWKAMLSRGVERAPVGVVDEGEVAELDEIAREQYGEVDWKKPILLDVRNGYEWDGGHFKGAMRPDVDEFKETSMDTPMGLPVDKEQPVMMYCTGGIRCDVYSAVLKEKGYNNIYTLEGGVHNYLKSEGSDLWDGALFVFDGRIAVGGEKAYASCRFCQGEAAPRHMNCGNVDCNALFLSCENCARENEGCCCGECRNSVRVRPFRTAAGYYERWGRYHDGSGATNKPSDGAATYDGPPRRTRSSAYRERRAKKRSAARAEVNQILQAASLGADVSGGGGGGEGGGGAPAGAREGPGGAVNGGR